MRKLEKPYRVVWEIDVDATNPLNAAVAAWQAMQRLWSVNNPFEVIAQDNSKETVDLRAVFQKVLLHELTDNTNVCWGYQVVIDSSRVFYLNDQGVIVAPPLSENNLSMKWLPMESAPSETFQQTVIDLYAQHAAGIKVAKVA